MAGSALSPATVAAVIRQAAADAPRSRQAELGPSEAGEPCARRLAYKMLGWPVTRETDPWAAVQGTAVHAWLAGAYLAENERLGRERYLVEHRVEPLSREESPVPGQLRGSCDLYDRDTGTVNDWKLTSPAQMHRYMSSGPGPRYRAQAHLYGRGLQRAGENIRAVAITFLPRSHVLDPVHTWSEPYDEAVALAAVKRLASIRDAVISLDPEANPDRWDLLPADYGSCRHCPWLAPGSPGKQAGCPGRLDDSTVPSLRNLIALREKARK